MKDLIYCTITNINKDKKESYYFQGKLKICYIPVRSVVEKDGKIESFKLSEVSGVYTNTERLYKKETLDKLLASMSFLPNEYYMKQNLYLLNKHLKIYNIYNQNQL